MQTDTQKSKDSTRYDGGSSVLPVEGKDAATILINDHKVIKRLLSELCDAKQDAKRTSVLEKLKGALTIHNAMEENLVYPALQVVAGKKRESESLYHETAAADVMVFKLDTMLKTGDDADFTATAEKLQAAVLEHIDDEETKAIPDLAEHASAEQAKMLTQAMQQFRAGLHVQAAS